MRQLPVNVGVLCDLVDFLCRSVILCSRRPGMTVLHDVTVPRSWLICFVKHDLPYLNPRIQINTYHLLLTRMWDLLEQLYDGNGSGTCSARIFFHFLMSSMMQQNIFCTGLPETFQMCQQ